MCKGCGLKAMDALEQGKVYALSWVRCRQESSHKHVKNTSRRVPRTRCGGGARVPPPFHLGATKRVPIEDTMGREVLPQGEGLGLPH